MDTVESLRKHFDKIKTDCSTPDRFDFGKRLIQNNDEEFLDFHYSLLRAVDIDKELYSWICKKFIDRHSIGENYLLDKIRTETDSYLKATILHILGKFKYSLGKRLTETAELARQYLNAEDDKLRCNSLWVLGWTGGLQDIDNLSKLLFNDSNNENRCWAATAMMQIFFNDKDVYSKALSYLKEAMEKESDLKALEGILISIQQITGKKLGLNASTYDPPDKDKVETALKKARKVLKDI